MKLSIKIISAVLSVLMLISLVSCDGDNGGSTADNAIKTKGEVMSYGDLSIDAKEFRYLASYVKDNVVFNQQYYLQQYTGTTYTEAEILAMPADSERTIGEYIVDYAIEFAQQLLIIKTLCNEADIEISEQEDLQEIEDYISDIEAAFGGEDYFEIELSELGFSRNGIVMLREYSYLYDLLYDFRYGQNGVAKVASDDITKYFIENYIRCDGAAYSYYVDGSPVTYEFSDEEIQNYFNDKYVKVRHILYKTTGLSDEKAAEKKLTATNAFNSIIAKEKTFDDYKKDNEDNGSEYVFTYGTMTKNFEEAAFEMEIGDVRLVETDFGFHIIEKLEKTSEDLLGKANESGATTGGIKTEVISKMSSDKIRNEALETLEKLNSGELDKYPAADTSKKYYAVIESMFLSKNDTNNKFFIDELVKNEKDKYFECEMYGTYLLRNLSFEGKDITPEIYSEIEGMLAVESFMEYVKSFYDAVKIDNEKIEQMQILSLPPLSDSFFVSN